MERSLSMSEAREQLTRLPEELMKHGFPETAAITRHGEPVLAVLPYDLYESILETLEILADGELTVQLRRSIDDVRAGRVVSLDELETRLAE